MTDLPAGFEPYHVTDRFTAQTVPAALTRRHATKAGVWGRIEVFAGKLDLTRCDAKNRVVVHETLHAGQTALVAPGEPHAVALDAEGKFCVTFLRRKELSNPQDAGS